MDAYCMLQEIQTSQVSFTIPKVTHMCRRWGTPHKFFLVFIDELEKLLRKLLKPIKNVRI